MPSKVRPSWEKSIGRSAAAAAAAPAATAASQRTESIFICMMRDAHVFAGTLERVASEYLRWPFQFHATVPMAIVPGKASYLYPPYGSAAGCPYHQPIIDSY